MTVTAPNPCGSSPGADRTIVVRETATAVDEAQPMTGRRSARLLRGITSLAATLFLLVGVPVLLATLVGWLAPRQPP